MDKQRISIYSQPTYDAIDSMTLQKAAPQKADMENVEFKAFINRKNCVVKHLVDKRIIFEELNANKPFSIGYVGNFPEKYVFSFYEYGKNELKN